mmetsp:Transcript_21188/g.47812  ORF Transcript_21188/g.47812 Transcript_21188/m.47812 type:complete len:222 (+) Transcript_21188:247-912(+)
MTMARCPGAPTCPSVASPPLNASVFASVRISTRKRSWVRAMLSASIRRADGRMVPSTSSVYLFASASRASPPRPDTTWLFLLVNLSAAAVAWRKGAGETSSGTSLSCLRLRRKSKRPFWLMLPLKSSIESIPPSVNESPVVVRTRISDARPSSCSSCIRRRCSSMSSIATFSEPGARSGMEKTTPSVDSRSRRFLVDCESSAVGGLSPTALWKRTVNVGPT